MGYELDIERNICKLKFLWENEITYAMWCQTTHPKEISLSDFQFLLLFVIGYVQGNYYSLSFLGKNFTQNFWIRKKYLNDRKVNNYARSSVE